MSESANQAVFLSYASQDVAAVARIAVALRAAGVEVWFDQNELVGGDAWDAKIRKQIAECALFVPVVSAATQARHEGYFRLEWKLAAQRTHMMSGVKAFLLPVVIDETRDAAAHVPEEFRAVQWTRLPGGEAAEKFCARVGKLLGGGTIDPGPVAGRTSGPQPGPPSPSLRRVPAAAWWVAVAVALGAGGYFALRPTPNAAVAARPAAASATAPVAPPVSEARRLAAEAEALIADDFDATRENYQLAEELCQKALTLDTADAELWALAARISLGQIFRSYDSSRRRLEQARNQAERAMRLDAHSVKAALVEVKVQFWQKNDAEAERLLQVLLARAPNDRGVLRQAAESARVADREKEVGEYLGRLQALPGGDPYSLFVEAHHLINRGRYAEAGSLLDRLLAAAPRRLPSYEKFYLLVRGWSDLEAARDFFQRLPARFLDEDAFVGMAARMWLRLGDGEEALKSLQRVPHEFLEEFGDVEPKGYLAGWAQKISGRSAAAALEWRQALDLVEARLATEPKNLVLLEAKALLLASLGEKPAALATMRLREELGNERKSTHGMFSAAVLALTGETEAAVAKLESKWPTLPFHQRSYLRGELLYEPQFASIRDDPRVRRLIAEHTSALDKLKGAAADAPKPDDKSVAVLAFDNRSDDKDAEYFSDGISEELINALGRVPGLTVKGRTSAFYFKGRNATAQEIAEKLGVNYLVRGSVRKAGGTVRITAQLSRAATDEVLWSSEPLERQVKDVFAVQDEIVGLIAKSLSVRMGVPARAVQQVNPDALTALLQGRQFWVMRTSEGFARARELFNRAVTLDPDWASAHAALASLEAIEASFLRGDGGSVEARFALATREAKRALELDATLGEPHAALGKIAMEYRRPVEAEQEFRRALALEPNNALVHDWYGDFSVTQGRLDVAIAEYGHAMELEPLSPYIVWDLAWELMNVRRYGEALALVERAATLTPTGTARYTLRRARLLMELGRHGEAEAALRAYLESPLTGSDPQFINEAVWCLQVLGSSTDRERWTAELLQKYPGTYASGVILLMLGQAEKAFPLLERVPPIFLQQIYWEPVFDSVRDTPRFRQLLEKLGCVGQYEVARATQARLLQEQAARK